MPSTDAADRADVADLADLADLGLDEGGHLLIDRALERLAPGGRLTVTGRHPALGVHLAAWCRAHGHRLAGSGDGDAEPTLVIVKGSTGQQRWSGAERAGSPAGPPD